MPDKQTLRKHFVKIRNDISQLAQQESASDAAKIFLQNIPINKNDIISAYYPVSNEISPLPLLEQISAIGNITALPIVKSKDQPLEFQKWQYGDKLYDSQLFNLKEPRGEIVIPTIVIVPLLAFDKNGHRLGYGGGFYDRTLNDLKQSDHPTTSIGYAYSCQKTDQIPIHNGDYRLDYIITDKAIFAF